MYHRRISTNIALIFSPYFIFIYQKWSLIRSGDVGSLYSPMFRRNVPPWIGWTTAYFISLQQHSNQVNKHLTQTFTLGKKCPYSESFWSAFFPHFPAFGLNTERCGVFSPNSGKCWKNADLNNSEHGHFLRSVKFTKKIHVDLKVAFNLRQFIQA